MYEGEAGEREGGREKGGSEGEGGREGEWKTNIHVLVCMHYMVCVSVGMCLLQVIVQPVRDCRRGKPPTFTAGQTHTAVHALHVHVHVCACLCTHTHAHAISIRWRKYCCSHVRGTNLVQDLLFVSELFVAPSRQP